MPEVPPPGEDHGEAMLVGGGYHFLIADRPTRMDHGGCAGLGDGVEAIAKWKEGV